MGTYINVFLTHDLRSWRDEDEARRRLQPTEPLCRAVDEYWRSVQSYEDYDMGWGRSDTLEELVGYTGPGALYLEITPRAARIHTGARWRGFLTFPPLHRVHVAAFRSIAAALGSEKLAITHDSVESVAEAFWSGATQSECIAGLEAELGPPQPSLDRIEPWIIAEAEHKVPRVWYLDVLPVSAGGAIVGMGATPDS